MDIIEQYKEETGAKAAVYLGEFAPYGKVWEMRYGEIDSQGLVAPTGLPVLAYVKGGKVETILGFDALDLISRL